MKDETKSQIILFGAMGIGLAIGYALRTALVYFGANWAIAPWSDTRIGLMAAFGMTIAAEALLHVAKPRGGGK